MASFFSVVRFVPDSIANEVVNVALLVASGDRVEVRPLNTWERVRHFAGSTWREAQRLVEELANDPKTFLGVERVDNADQLRSALSRWTRALQFSDVRASLDSPEALVQSLEPLILVGQRADMASPQSRRAFVVRTVYRAIMSAFELRFERRARGLVRQRAEVRGRRTQHKLDVGVLNGNLYAGAFALSFSTGQVDRQWKDTDAVAFAVEDVRADLPDVPLGVVVDAPEGGSEASQRAVELLRPMLVEIVQLSKVDDWARQVIRAVPDAAVLH